MEIIKTYNDDCCILSLTGEVDLESSPELRQTLIEEVNKAQHIIVNMAEVHYIDSSGIASLVEAFQGVRHKGMKFALVDVSEGAMRVLSLARLDKVFTLFQIIDEALSDF